MESSKMSNKKKVADCVSDTSYAVIEKKDKNGVYVEFVPTLWMRPLKPNGKLVVRAEAHCYFPRRLPGQTKDQYSKFVKNAKLIIVVPENDGKWELLKCRVLKIAIDCIDDAMNAEKVFSDFFDTTEAEAEILKLRSPPAKRVKKNKKPATETKRRKASSDDTDSERERDTSDLTEGICDYNVAFTHESMGENLVARSGSMVQGDTVVQFVDQMPDGLDESEQETMIDMSRNNYVVNLDRVVTSQFINQCELQNQNCRSEVQQLVASTKEMNCNCMDKVRNKMDYFQKRVIGEIADFRHEVMKSIRNLTDTVLRASSTNQPTSQDTPDEEVDKSDELIEKYSGTIPVNNKVALHAINKRIKSDAEFKMFMDLKFERIIAVDATKTARRMLNAVCTVTCFGQFTWLGTKEKDRFNELQFLIEFMTKILENRFPKCGAYRIIELVVKQRTKSAGEAVRGSAKSVNAVDEFQDGNPDLPTEQQYDEDFETQEIADGQMLFHEPPAPFDPDSLMNF